MKMKRIKNITSNLIYSVKMGIFTYKNPLLFQTGAIKLTERIMDFLNETSKNNHPMMCEIKITVSDSENIPVLRLWCSPIEGQTPLKRINELVKEKEALQYKLDQYENKLI